MDETYKKLLIKQGYRFVGNHSAIKICEWTRKSLRGKGVCYKEKFYGIKSHRCCQISPSINFCDMDCVFCWRERHNSPFEQIDEPKKIIENAVIEQRKLLTGFGGMEDVDPEKFKESQNPNQFAISLTGESLYYPKLSELIRELKKKKCSVFLVTNGSRPDILEKLEMPTQLYISLDAPNKEIFKNTCRPMKKNAWKDFLRSLSVMKKLGKKTRTVIRITVVNGINDVHPEQYAKLLEKAKPMFVEVKAYMFIGASRQRLSIENMPRHEEIKEFAEEISQYCDYRIVDEQQVSRVVLMKNMDEI